MKKKIEGKDGVLIAFGELFLKSNRVRRLFKRKLIQNLTIFIRKCKIPHRLYPFHERIFLEAPHKKVKSILKRLFGISWFAPAIFFPQADVESVSCFIGMNYQNWIKRNQTFALRVKRDPSVKKSSEEIITKIARKIKRAVRLEKPEKEIFIEARRFGWFLYFKKNKGPGGLPVGSGGKALVLISGGIDSPVAGYFIAKRGVENVWLHFHSFPLLSRSSIEKVKDLAKIFLKFQPKLKVYFFPLHRFQIEIKTKAPPRYRILLYRRIMLKIAEKIAEKENCLALVTGESIGQVSSQTLQNIKVIEGVTSLPILRPLVGMDKEEIIQIAKKLGTFQISAKPQEDCCTLFVPPHASAHGKIEEILSLERRLHTPIDIKSAEVVYFF